MGKLAVISAPGKADRLVGDTTVSGVNPAAQLGEKVQYASVSDIARGLALVAQQEEPWKAIVIDIKSAHKQVKVREEDGGLAFFQFQGKLYRYKRCHFGASYAAYWWGRLSSAVHRVLRHLLYEKHLGFCFVDDSCLMTPARRSALCALLALALFAALGLPLSWAKVRLASLVKYLGFWLNLRRCSMTIPRDKRTKALECLRQVRVGSRLS